MQCATGGTVQHCVRHAGLQHSRRSVWSSGHACAGAFVGPQLTGTCAHATCMPCLCSPVQAWHLTGDVYSKKAGDKPWISEMYGYSFGAAKAGVWHKSEVESMLYPGYQPVGE